LLKSGFVYGSNWDFEYQVATIGQMALLAMGLLGSISGLSLLSQDILYAMRDFEAGVSLSSYFMGKNIDLLIDTLFHSIIYFSIFFFLIAPLSSYITLFWVFLIICWTTAGFGFICAIAMARESALIGAVILPLIFAGFFSGITPLLPSMNPLLRSLADIFYIFYFFFSYFIH